MKKEEALKWFKKGFQQSCEGFNAEWSPQDVNTEKKLEQSFNKTWEK